MDGTPPTEGGLFSTLARMVKTLRDLVENRLELFLVELKEERIRLFDALLLAAAGMAFALMSLITLTLTVVVLFWETHRVLALVVMTGVYVVLAAGVLGVLRARLHQWRAFSSTLEQIKKDRSCLEKPN